MSDGFDKRIVDIAFQQNADIKTFKEHIIPKVLWLFENDKIVNGGECSTMYWDTVKEITIVNTMDFRYIKDLKKIIRIVYGLDKMHGTDRNYIAHFIAIPMERQIMEGVVMRALFTAFVNSYGLRTVKCYYMDDSTTPASIKVFDEEETSHIYKGFFLTATAPTIGFYYN